MSITATRNASPVLLITRDQELIDTYRRTLGDIFAVIAPDRSAAIVDCYWDDAPAVIIGADAVHDAAGYPLSPRAGVYVVTTPGGAMLGGGAATVAADAVVELGQDDGPEWLAARVRHLAAGGDAGAPANGCGECGAETGEPCRVDCLNTWH